MSKKRLYLGWVIRLFFILLTGSWIVFGDRTEDESGLAKPRQAQAAIEAIPDSSITFSPDTLKNTPLLQAKASEKILVGRRILLVGDSQAEGLMHPLNAYCESSGHTLVLAFPWYSSRVETFASNDTLKNLILRIKPDYVIMVIGLNQVFQQNMESASSAISSINKVFGDIPVSWIGPVNWKDDWGINETLANNVPSGAFFLSENLPVSRASDGRHPDVAGYRLWMDSISAWLNNRAKWKIRMVKPETFYGRKRFPVITLNAVKRTPPVKTQKPDSLRSSVISKDTVKQGH